MSARLAPPAPEALAPDVARLLRATAQSADREPPGTMALLAHAPALLAPFIGWAASLALKGALSHRQHELLALRAAWRCRSAFEWGEHAELARAAGLDAGEIARLGRDEVGAAWSPADAALLRAADQLVARCAIDDAAWAALAAHFEPAALVEIPLVVGQYTMLSMLANAARLAARPGDAALP
jgi:alkylhydroperoxidase family enzyme